MKHLRPGTFPTVATATAWAVLATAGFSPETIFAQNFPITATQSQTARQVAQAGVPLEELAPDAPDRYVVKAGDTLWAISGMYLKRPWRWPELWGMNYQEIRNPHLIYPGQVLHLERQDGRARLRVGEPADGSGVPTIKLSPSVRAEGPRADALPTLKNNQIEPFLAEPVVVDELALSLAPRIVAMTDNRVLLSHGDRAYALGPPGQPLLEGPDRPKNFRVYRNPKPLIDPMTREVLGFEAPNVGRAQLVAGESTTTVPGSSDVLVVPATIQIVGDRREMAPGDRLAPEPPRPFISYTPHAPDRPVDARIASFYGDAVIYAGQNQIVTINRGTRDGIEIGHVLAVSRPGRAKVDTTTGIPVAMQLPDQRLGLLMVFRPFERVSYALLLQVSEGVAIGDVVTNP
ncbi:LysM peptidoglycan-binding domain-containing protein [Candidatus Skiveiella danica]|uniref:LysM peptidoglycan-binding domain-containing protein n=1 Tax=Candidatus Skiveiella danica TaxID=3386177 RepID=UPI0009CE2B15|nr:MAG: LysM domain/BON superfamily protein [Alphaproteobacteria bacterium ADurb.Bin100]